ncbi:hypothetical protein EDB85DRAFT_2028646, partial [Lactarius pseudohatsudake]
MHNGLPLSLLDFLLVTAMLLVTPSEEWTNVTRTSPSDSFLDDGSPSDLSLGVLSSNGLPSSSSLSSGTPDIAALLHTSEATPEIDRWPLMAAQQARHRPERQAVCHPTPMITRQCNTQHIRLDKGYLRRIR